MITRLKNYQLYVEEIYLILFPCKAHGRGRKLYIVKAVDDYKRTFSGHGKAAAQLNS